MSINRNNKAVASIFRGEQPIGKAYRGDRLVFQKGGGALDFLNFTAVEDGSSVKYSTLGSYESAEYSYDKVSWADANDVVIFLNKGQKVYFRGLITRDKDYSLYAIFTMTGRIAAGGSIMSLCNGDPSETEIRYLNAFYKMFYSCTSLTTAPELPATTLAGQCYTGMFWGCTSLTTAPELPATTLASSCYNAMFKGCTSLTTVPELPATTLAGQCYREMFYSCTSLTTAPELPATTLVGQCYNSMFNGCNKIEYVKIHATDISAYNCLINWLSGVSSSGTFYKKAGVSYPSGTSGIPDGWTVVEF